MSKLVVYMSMSLDGFIAAADDGPGRGLGVGGEPLHSWLAGFTPENRTPERQANDEVFKAMMSTGAVITGRHTFEWAGNWHGDHHDGVPIFVLTRHEADHPPIGHARYISDLGSAVAQAKAAAGDRDVMMHGASAVQSILHIGLVDEFVISLVPILLGRGKRLFDDPTAQLRHLELVQSIEGEGVLHLRYRVMAESG